MHLLKRNSLLHSSVYEEFDKFKKECKGHEVNIVNGDFNAKVGRSRHTDITGGECLGEMNERGEKLME